MLMCYECICDILEETTKFQLQRIIRSHKSHIHKYICIQNTHFAVLLLPSPPPTHTHG